MQWTMPLRTRQIVASLIGLSALTAFVLGIVNAPSRGRLPGERAAEGGGAAIEATEAMPLSQERIEGPPPPTPLTEEQKAKLEADRLAKAGADAAAKAAAAAGQPPAPTLPVPAPAPVAAPAAPAAPPPPEQPPF
jgi:hypothetical protein